MQDVSAAIAQYARYADYIVMSPRLEWVVKHVERSGCDQQVCLTLYEVLGATSSTSETRSRIITIFRRAWVTPNMFEVTAFGASGYSCDLDDSLKSSLKRLADYDALEDTIPLMSREHKVAILTAEISEFMAAFRWPEYSHGVRATIMSKSVRIPRCANIIPTISQMLQPSERVFAQQDYHSAQIRIKNVFSSRFLLEVKYRGEYLVLRVSVADGSRQLKAGTRVNGIIVCDERIDELCARVLGRHVQYTPAVVAQILQLISEWNSLPSSDRHEYAQLT